MFEHPYTHAAGRDLGEHQRDLISASMPGYYHGAEVWGVDPRY